MKRIAFVVLLLSLSFTVAYTQKFEFDENRVKKGEGMLTKLELGEELYNTLVENYGIDYKSKVCIVLVKIIGRDDLDLRLASSTTNSWLPVDSRIREDGRWQFIAPANSVNINLCAQGYEDFRLSDVFDRVLKGYTLYEITLHAPILQNKNGVDSLTVVTKQDDCHMKLSLDGKTVMDTLFSQMITIPGLKPGKYILNLSKSGYDNINREINFTGNYNLESPLEKTLIYAKVTISSEDKDATLFIDGKFHSAKDGKYEGELGTGYHSIVARRSGCTDSRLDVTITGDEPQYFTIKAPVVNNGKIDVVSRPSGADIYVDGKYSGQKTPFVLKLPKDEYYIISVRKEDYISSEKSVQATESRTKSSFHLKKDPEHTWYGREQMNPDHFLEAYYGLGINSSVFKSGYDGHSCDLDHYVGLSYGWLPNRWGLHTSAMYGITNHNFVFTAGPALRLTEDSNLADFQFYAGGGVAYTDRITWAADFGVRLSFCNWRYDYNFSWWSMNIGVKYFDRKFVPNIGISLMPIGLFTVDYGDFWIAREESSFPKHYFEPMVGYAFGMGGSYDDVMIGGTYSWVKTHLGIYGTVLGGIGGNAAIAVGPVLRLTGDSQPLDLHLYAGTGWSTYNGNNTALGDVGLRFGFKNANDGAFGWWSFSLGCMFYGANAVVPTAGLSIGVAGMAALIGGCGVLGWYLSIM